MLNLHLYTQSLVFKVCLLWWKQFLRNSLASSVLQFWAVFFNPEGRIKLSTGEAVYTSRSRRYVTAASTADSRDPTITPLRAFPGAAALRALSPSVRAWGKGAASSVGEAGDLGAGSQTPLRFTGQTGTPRPRRLGGGGGRPPPAARPLRRRPPAEGREQAPASRAAVALTFLVQFSHFICDPAGAPRPWRGCRAVLAAGAAGQGQSRADGWALRAQAAATN